MSHTQPSPRGPDARTSPWLPDPAQRLAKLTPREREVLDHVARGLTDREIGVRLFISRPTVSTHLTNILAKLGVPNRTAAAVLAGRSSA